MVIQVALTTLVLSLAAIGLATPHRGFFIENAADRIVGAAVLIGLASGLVAALAGIWGVHP